jgi:hypothetical protein
LLKKALRLQPAASLTTVVRGPGLRRGDTVCADAFVACRYCSTTAFPSDPEFGNPRTRTSNLVLVDRWLL